MLLGENLKSKRGAKTKMMGEARKKKMKTRPGGIPEERCEHHIEGERENQQRRGGKAEGVCGKRKGSLPLLGQLKASEGYTLRLS